MTTSQKLTIRASEIRARLNEIAGLEGEAFTTEIRSECDKLTGEYTNVESQLRAAMVAEDAEAKEAETRGGGEDADAEVRELRSLQGRTSFSRYMRAFVDQSALDGAERELNEVRGLATAGNVLPWDALLDPRAASPDRELRADAVTPSPASGNPVSQTAIIQRVFARSGLHRLGVPMPSVPVGTASYPVITSGQSAQFVAKDGSKEAAAGVIGANTLEPVRLQARVTFRVEDTMTTLGLEDALREDLNLSMMDQVDAQSLGLGDPRVRGFLATAANGGLADYADPTAVTTFATAAAQAARGVDGKFAGAESECVWVVGTESYSHLASLIQANDSTSATERLRRLLRDFMASANIPAAASNIQQGILAKLGAMDGYYNAVCPVWEGLRFIRDELTAAADGRIAVTAVALYNFKVLRPAGFVRTALKLA